METDSFCAGYYKQHLKMARVLALLVFGLCFVRFYDACPTHECPCFQEEEIDCTDMMYKYVPDWFPENTTYYMLDLSKNKIRRLDALAFKGLRVQKIRVKSNRHEMMIHPQAFSGLEDYLKVLQFKGNKIQALPAGLFKGMDKLKHIDLSDNGKM